MYVIYNAETLEKLIKLYMYYTASNPHMKIICRTGNQSIQVLFSNTWRLWYTTLCHQLNTLFENDKRQIYRNVQ